MVHIDFKRFRKDKNLNQEDLAKLFNCGQSFISDLERGRKGLPQDKLDLLQIKYGDITRYITKADIPSPSPTRPSAKEAASDGTERLLEVIMEQSRQLSRSQEQLTKSQEQIDRLISIIERR